MSAVAIHPTAAKKEMASDTEERISGATAGVASVIASAVLYLARPAAVAGAARTAAARVPWIAGLLAVIATTTTPDGSARCQSVPGGAMDITFVMYTSVSGPVNTPSATPSAGDAWAALATTAYETIALPTDQTSITEEPMRTKLAASLLAATFAIPAFADNPPRKGSDADEAFMTGIRKLGVMSGEAYACSSEADQPQVGQGAIDLATQVSLHFGLQAAFVYSGSFGYGTAHDFDRKNCPQAIADFKALQAKYLGR